MGRTKRDADLREAADLVKSAREAKLPNTRLFHCSDDVQWQNRMGNELIEWADNRESLVLDNFPLSKKLAPYWFYNMRNKNAYFAQCLEYAKAKIGERLQMKLLSDKISGSQEYMIKQLPKLDTLWIEERKENLANKDRIDPIVNIVMPDCGTEKK